MQNLSFLTYVVCGILALFFQSKQSFFSVHRFLKFIVSLNYNTIKGMVIIIYHSNEIYQSHKFAFTFLRYDFNFVVPFFDTKLVSLVNDEIQKKENQTYKQKSFDV